MVVSLKANRKRILSFILLAAIVAGACFFLTGRGEEEARQPMRRCFWQGRQHSWDYWPVCFSCPVRSGISVCAGGTEKTLNNYQNPARICKRNRVRLFFEL